MNRINELNHKYDTYWQENNYKYLLNCLGKIYQALKAKINGENPQDLSFNYSYSFSPPPALKRLKKLFDLSAFDENILLLCMGMELYSSWGNFCAEIAGDPRLIYPTFSLALSLFPQPTWSAFTPVAPLRFWHLIELGSNYSINTSPLKLDERILHYLCGIHYLDESLASLSQPISNYFDSEINHLIPSHQEIITQITNIFLASESDRIVIELCGGDIISKEAISQETCNQLQCFLYKIAIKNIPQELGLFKRKCEREWLLSHSILLLDCEEMNPERDLSTVQQLITEINCPLIISTRDRLTVKNKPVITFFLSNLSYEDQRKQWELSLAKIEPSLTTNLDYILANFNLSASQIKTACYQFKSIPKQEQTWATLWEICRREARPFLEDLCTRIEVKAEWEDLVLPEEEKNILREIAAHLRQRITVYKQWGWEKKSSKGLGISALFTGASGTGKTMAAELLGKELNLDVYKIDLSSVVSKYIGETEKNLRRIFDTAEGCGAILLFDEADALFGKRSEVKDSHDRYANMEVSYLLQRIEAYQGLAILTTNFKSAIDQAFLRRIRFIVQFPFPNFAQRQEIWQRIFPPETPTQDLDFKKLAKLNVSGGNIRNIALNAAFIAADLEETVQMKHILQASQAEYVKLERPLTDNEVKGWI
jgi:AAA+ superfamily predicted ATPase